MNTTIACVAAMSYGGFRTKAIVLCAAAFCLMIAACGPRKHRIRYITAVSAELVEQTGQLFVVLHNYSDTVYTICTRNFYDPIQCLDIRGLPDTSEFPAAQLFGGVLSGVVRKIITADDFVALEPGRELRLPVDMRPIRKDVGAGKPVLMRVYFRNIDPFSCSRTGVTGFDKMVQNYCTLMHYAPLRDLHYWAGEVRTPYISLNLAPYVQKQQKAVKKARREVVVHRSRTNPLKHKVFR